MSESTSAQPETAPSSAPAVTSDAQVPAVASSLLTLGQQQIAKQSYAEAAETFSKAVEALTSEHGEMSIQTVDALILYGKALLRNAVAQSGVFGNTAKKEEAPAADADAPSAPIAGPSAPPKISAQLPAAEAPAEDKGKFNFVEFEEEEGDDAEEGEGEGGEEDDTREDDLETSFNVLDMARTILVKHATDEEDKLKLASVYNALGEVATESEKFDEAAAEYVNALQVISAILPPHDRRLAETHMMAALSFEFIPVMAQGTQEDVVGGSSEITPEEKAAKAEQARLKAVEHAEEARRVLVLKKAHLLDLSKTRDKKDTSVMQEDLKELKNIDEVMAELDAKIDDLKTMPEIAAATERDKLVAQAFSASTLPADAPRNNLNNLVKKKKPKAAEISTEQPESSKRKAEDEAAPVSAKKSRVEDVPEA